MNASFLANPLTKKNMLSNIQILKHIFSRFEVISHESEAEGLVRINYNLNAHPKETEDESRVWEVTLDLKFSQTEETTPQALGYEGRVVLTGLFIIHPDFKEEKVEALARMNGGAVLMGAAREAILNQTLRSIHGPIELPLIDARSFLPEEAEKTNLIPG